MLHVANNEASGIWAGIWGASVLLGEVMLSPGIQAEMQDAWVLEAGAGSGILSLMAAKSGAGAVVMTDYAEQAVELASANAALNGVSERMVTGRLDWFHMESVPVSVKRRMNQFDMVLGSDVLFMSDFQEPVADLLLQTMAPDGVAIIADPGRVTAIGFDDTLLARGLRVTTHEASCIRFTEAGDVMKKFVLYVVTGARGPSPRSLRISAAAAEAVATMQDLHHAPEFEKRISGFSYVVKIGKPAADAIHV